MPFLLANVFVACSAEGPRARDDVGEDTFADTADGTTDGVVTPPPDSVPVRDCRTTFLHTPGKKVGQVEVAGEWDDFKGRTTLIAVGTTYRATANIPAGDWGYKIVLDGGKEWILDPEALESKYVGGTENSRVRVRDCKLPDLSIVGHEAKADGAVTATLQYTDGNQAKGPDSSKLVVSLDRAPFPGAALDEKSGRIVVRASGLSKGKHTFSVEIADKSGQSSQKIFIPTWIEDEAFQWIDGPLYFVFTDRFRNGDPSNDGAISSVDPRANYQGGDLEGVRKALEEGYFDALGVRSIWLSPVYGNSKKPGKGSDGRDYSAYHGYWPTSARTVDPRFGSLDTLRSVTSAAHKRGIRVILDVVMNQLHQDHEYVASHRKDGWFNGDGSCVCGSPGCSWDERTVDCWFTSYLPDVNWTNAAVETQLMDDAMFWLIEGDADGLRVDAVKHMNEIASRNLRGRITSTLEGGNARYWLVGETFTGGDGRPLIKRYIGPRLLQGQFDFPLYWAIDNAFASSAGTMSDLDNAARASETEYGPGALMSPFLGNHDVPRFLSRAAGMVGSNPLEQAWTAPPGSPDNDSAYERTFLAFVFTLSQQGVPLIYYGDEVGTAGTADPDNRRMMKTLGYTPREQKLFDRVRIVGKARGTLPGLKRGQRTGLYADGDGLVFARGKGRDVVLVSINRGGTARTVKVAIAPELAANGVTFTDLLGGPPVTVKDGAIEVPLSARGASLWVVK